MAPWRKSSKIEPVVDSESDIKDGDGEEEGDVEQAIVTDEVDADKLQEERAEGKRGCAKYLSKFTTRQLKIQLIR